MNGAEAAAIVSADHSFGCGNNCEKSEDADCNLSDFRGPKAAEQQRCQKKFGNRKRNDNCRRVELALTGLCREMRELMDFKTRRGQQNQAEQYQCDRKGIRRFSGGSNLIGRFGCGRSHARLLGFRLHMSIGKIAATFATGIY